MEEGMAKENLGAEWERFLKKIKAKGNSHAQSLKAVNRVFLAGARVQTIQAAQVDGLSKLGIPKPEAIAMVDGLNKLFGRAGA
jgi:hypothetical protein